MLYFHKCGKTGVHKFSKNLGTTSKFYKPDRFTGNKVHTQILVLNSPVGCSPKNTFYMFGQQGYLTAFLKQAAQSSFFSPQVPHIS
jgi:hypothetical protein